MKILNLKMSLFIIGYEMSSEKKRLFNTKNRNIDFKKRNKNNKNVKLKYNAWNSNSFRRKQILSG